MSFASEVKNELCRVPVSRHCCAVAEAYGVLLYCHTYREIYETQYGKRADGEGMA